MPYGPRRESSCWKAYTRTAGSIGTKSRCSWQASAGENRPKKAADASAVSSNRNTMKSVLYSRYTAEDLGLSAEDLLKALSDFLLESGFQSPYMQFSEMNQQTLEDLKQALQRALERGEMFDQERAEKIRQMLDEMSAEDLDQLLNRLAQKLADEG